MGVIAAVFIISRCSNCSWNQNQSGNSRSILPVFHHNELHPSFGSISTLFLNVIFISSLGRTWTTLYPVLRLELASQLLALPSMSIIHPYSSSSDGHLSTLHHAVIHFEWSISPFFIIGDPYFEWSISAKAVAVVSVRAIAISVFFMLVSLD